MILEKVREIMASQLGIDEDQITEETDIKDDLGADSLDIMELLMSLEEEYGLMIADEDVEGLRTVSDVVSFIENKLN